MIGSANIDFSVTTARLPKAGETVTGGDLTVSFGGKGANQALAAKRLGADVRLVVCLGRDEHGDRIAKHLRAAGIPSDGIVRTRKAPTGTALIVVDQKGRNQITVAPGANAQLTVDRIQEREADIAWAQVLLVQLELPIETVRWALERAMDHEVLTILNPAPFRPLPYEILSMVDILTPNAVEAAALAGFSVAGLASAKMAAAKLQKRGARDVVVTLGKRGAFCLTREGKSSHFKGFSIPVVDTTAAGDAFNGALACGMASGIGIDSTIPMASAAAALACTVRGAQQSLPDRTQVERFLELEAVEAGRKPPSKT